MKCLYAIHVLMNIRVYGYSLGNNRYLDTLSHKMRERGRLQLQRILLSSYYFRWSLYRKLLHHELFITYPVIWPSCALIYINTPPDGYLEVLRKFWEHLEATRPSWMHKNNEYVWDRTPKLLCKKNSWSNNNKQA